MGYFYRLKQFFASGLDIVSAILHSFSDDPAVWEKDIRKFEMQDRLNPPPRDPIVFTGSSSITYWSTLEQDMAPLPVINRGFGGSHLRDVIYYVPRVILPYHPRAVVLFAGTNDISGRRPKNAREVYEAYLAFVSRVRSSLPETPIYYVSITPTPSRWKLWPIAQEANQLIRTYTETGSRLYFIDLTRAILRPDGKPDRSLYRFDRLHPNAKGYARWTAVIKPVLMDGRTGDKG